MKSHYVSDLQPDEVATGIFLVQHKDIRQKKSGEPYLSLVLGDRTGDVEAKMFDNAAEVMDTFDRGAFVRAKGLLQVFQNRPQFTLHKLLPVADSEVDPSDFFPASKRDRDEMFLELRGWIAGVANPHLKALLESIFADPEIALAYRTAPAAKTVHHAWLGGLIEHVLSLCHLAKFTATHYPVVDFDLLLAGVLLHDIGKIRELSYARAFGYSTEGQLLGHIHIGAGIVQEKLRLLPDFPPKLRDLLLHLILSHHGELEFGSPKVPLFAEALLLHHLDNLDSKMECVRGGIEKDRQVEGEWTGYISALDRTILKKEKYLAPEAPKAPSTPHVEPAPAEAKAPPPKRPEPSSSPFASKLKDALTQNS